LTPSPSGGFAALPQKSELRAELFNLDDKRTIKSVTKSAFEEKPGFAQKVELESELDRFRALNLQ
jgi:hypothetical protein